METTVRGRGGRPPRDGAFFQRLVIIPVIAVVRGTVGRTFSNECNSVRAKKDRCAERKRFKRPFSIIRRHGYLGADPRMRTFPTRVRHKYRPLGHGAGHGWTTKE